MSIGNFLEIMSQAILVGIILVGRLGACLPILMPGHAHLCDSGQQGGKQRKALTLPVYFDTCRMLGTETSTTLDVTPSLDCFHRYVSNTMKNTCKCNALPPSRVPFSCTGGWKQMA